MIAAFELLGAAYATDNESYNIETSYEYLMQAMKMRYADADHVIHKATLAPIPAYDNWLETRTIEDLRAIRLNHHSIHMEALTTLERILGRNNPRLADAIVYRGTMMVDLGRFRQCELLWNYAMNLRVLNKVLIVIYTHIYTQRICFFFFFCFLYNFQIYILQITIESDLMRFVQLYTQLIRTDIQNVQFTQVLSVFTSCQEELQRTKIKMQEFTTTNPLPHIILV